jgi:hypothetical protein
MKRSQFDVSHDQGEQAMSIPQIDKVLYAAKAHTTGV